MADGEYFFCLTHETVEAGVGCRGADRMGPYPSAEAAAQWRTAHASREDAWKATDDDEDGA